MATLALLAGCQREAGHSVAPVQPPESLRAGAAESELAKPVAPYQGSLNLVPVETSPAPIMQTAHARPADCAAGEHVEPLLRRVLHEDPTTPLPVYGHAADYGWLTGELRYVFVRNAWCLQYASADENDGHGGNVTLCTSDPMTAYHSGQNVRVEGRLLNPDSREPSPVYEVRALQALTALSVRRARASSHGSRRPLAFCERSWTHPSLYLVREPCLHNAKRPPLFAFEDPLILRFELHQNHNPGNLAKRIDRNGNCGALGFPGRLLKPGGLGSRMEG